MTIIFDETCRSRGRRRNGGVNGSVNGGKWREMEVNEADVEIEM